MRSIVRSLVSWVFGSRHSGVVNHSRWRTLKPIVESLEDRCAPAIIPVTVLTDADPSPAGSLRRAIETANTNNDTSNSIVFASDFTGTVSLVERLPAINKSVEIVRGPGAPAAITIRRDPDAPTQFDILGFSGFSGGGRVLISGFTISGGTEGAIFASGLHPNGDSLVNFTMRQCTLSGNYSTERGGALFIENVTYVNISDCVFNNNSTTADGGAISVTGMAAYFKRTLSISNTDFRENTAGYGVPTGNGGAIYTDIDAGVTIRGGSFILNKASVSGGAIFRALEGNQLRARLLVTGSLFLGNQALSRDGGAIWNGWGTDGTIAGCLLMLNTAGRNGGAIYDPYEGFDSNGNTFFQNAADADGGAWCSVSGTGTFVNTIFFDNTAGEAGADVFGTINSLGHNLIGDDTDSDGWVGSDILNEDPLLGDLGFHGGTTQTMLLLEGSPALDAGDDYYARDFDERGYDGLVGDHVDIGAVEMQAGEFELESPYAYNVAFSAAVGSSFSIDGADGAPTLIDYSGNSGNASVSITEVNGSDENLDTPITTYLGGTVTVHSDGTFDYIAPDDTVGEDHFDITYSDGVNTRSGTVAINVTDLIAFDSDYSTLKNNYLSVSADPSGCLYSSIC